MHKPIGVFAALAAALLAISPLALGDGHLKSTENVDRIRPGATSTSQIQDWLGTPARKMRFPARGVETWEYEYREYSDLVVLSISFGGDGVVREIGRVRRGCV